MSQVVRAPNSLTRGDVEKFKKILQVGDLVYIPHSTCAYGEGDGPGWWEPYRVERKAAASVTCRPAYRTALMTMAVSYEALLKTMIEFEAAVAAGRITQVGRIRSCEAVQGRQGM